MSSGRLLVVLSALVLASAEPIPIQRIQLPPERVPAEMERARQKVLTRLSREEFEALVLQAARAEAAGKTPPRLLEATYQAALDGDGLAGSAKWKVLHSSSDPGRLSLNSLQLALRAAHWADKSPAVIGALDDRADAPLELLVERQGESALNLEWSARGIPEPGGIHFDLRLPPCPMTVVELILPADRTVLADRDGVVLSGPLPAEKPDLRTWRLSFPRQPGGTPAAQFVVRQPASPDALAPLLRPLIETKQKLLPGRVECEYVLDLQVQRGGLEEFTLLCDPGLRPHEVDAPGLESWEVKPAPGGATLIQLRLRDPIRGGRVIVRAVALPPPPDKTWVSPGIQVAGGIPRGERLTLHIHPDLQLEDWKPGGFRPIPAIAADPFQVVSLQRKAVGADSSARPQARIRTAPPAFDVVEALEWVVDPDRMTLTADLRVSARRGTLFQTSWQVPAGWDVEQVEGQPADPGLRWQARPGALTIEPSRPIADGKDSAERRWLVRLHAATPELKAGADGTAATIALPDLQPLEVRQREGRLTLRLHPALIALASDAGAVLRPDVPLAYRAGPRGSIQVRPRRARIQARVDSETIVRQLGAITNYRLELTPGANAGKEVILLTSAAVSGDWTWRTVGGTAEVQRLEALPLHGLLPILAAVAPASALDAVAHWRASELAAVHWWRLVFDQPLQKPVTLELTARSDARERMEVPLLSVYGADRLDAQAVVRLTPGSVWESDAHGAREEFGTRRDVASGWQSHTFRYGLTPASLALSRPLVRVRDRSSRVERALLVISPSLEGRTFYRFEFALGGWPERDLPIQMPAETDLVTARVNGSAVAIPSAAGDRDAGDRILHLPWGGGNDWGFVEIVYSSNQPSWVGWTRLNAALPQLPAPVQPRRVWRLPPGIAPLTVGGWRPLPGGPQNTPWPAIPWRQREKPSSAANARRAAIDEAVRKSPPLPSESFGAWLERWTFEHRELVGAIVLDADALAEAGLRPSSAIELKNNPNAIWTLLGLTPAPEELPLLTTQRQMARWAAGIPADVASAIADAVNHGHDSSGRFTTVPDWLASADNHSKSSGFDSRTEGWTDWEAVSGPTTDDPILVETSVLTIFGLAITILLVFLGLLGRRGWRFYIVTWLLIAALGMIWLPRPLWGLIIWPMVGAMVFAVSALAKGLLIRAHTPTVAPSSTSERGSSFKAIPLGLVLATCLALPSSAADPEPVPVFLVPASPDDREARAVLAPPDLIERLKAMARRGAPDVSSVVTTAHYAGNIDRSTIRWDAQFTVQCFADGQSLLELPLEGGRLRRARLDGVETLPRAQRNPDRLAFELRGRGAHSLQLEFDLPVTGQSDQEVRCSIPEVPINSITVQAPPGVTFLSAPEARGAQRIIPGNGGSRFEADLGRVGAIHLRWQISNAVSAQRPQVEEVSMWDLSESAARLRSVFRYRLGATYVDALEVNIPAGLELAAATARSNEGLANSLGPIVVRDWRRTSLGKVRIAFFPALTGQVQLELELVPVQSLGAKPALAVPTAAGEFERQSHLAVRLQDLHAAVAESRGWEPEIPEAFFRDLWQPLRVDPSDQDPDFAFHRGRDTSVELRLDLSLAPPSGEGEQRIFWQVGPGRSEVRIVATWPEAPPSGPLEWEVPENVVVSEIRGTGVRSWYRSGSLVQVWLGGVPAGANVNLTLWGWMARPADDQALEKTPFELPVIGMRGVPKQSTFVQVQPREGWRIYPYEIVGHRSAPSSDLPGAGWSGYGEGPCRAVFAVRPARGQVECRVLTEAEPAGRQVAFTGVIDVNSTGDAATGSIQSVLVEVRRAEPDKLQLQLPPGTRLRETRPAITGMTWVVDCLPGRHRLLVTGRLAVPASHELTMPSVSARGIGSSAPPQRWIVTLPGLRPREAAGLRTEAPPAEFLDGRQTEKLRRGGSSWAVLTDGWRLRLEVVPSGSVGAVSLTASAMEASAAPGDDGFWMLEARFFLFHETEGLWVVRPPKQGQLLAFLIDGFEQSIRPGLSRPVSPGLHAVRLVWRSAVPVSSPPPFGLPQIEIGGETVAWKSALWSAAAPPGFKLESEATNLGPAGFQLHRAAALLDLQQMADRVSFEALLSLRSSLQGALRRAEYDLATSSISSTGMSPDGRPYVEWLKQLRDAAPATALGESSPEPYTEPFHRGTPSFWQTSRVDSLALRLEPTDATPTDKSIMSGLLALAIVFGTIIVRRRR